MGFCCSETASPIKFIERKFNGNSKSSRHTCKYHMAGCWDTHIHIIIQIYRVRSIINSKEDLNMLNIYLGLSALCVRICDFRTETGVAVSKALYLNLKRC